MRLIVLTSRVFLESQSMRVRDKYLDLGAHHSAISQPIYLFKTVKLSRQRVSSMAFAFVWCFSRRENRCQQNIMSFNAVPTWFVFASDYIFVEMEWRWKHNLSSAARVNSNGTDAEEKYTGEKNSREIRDWCMWSLGWCVCVCVTPCSKCILIALRREFFLVSIRWFQLIALLNRNS